MSNISSVGRNTVPQAQQAQFAAPPPPVNPQNQVTSTQATGFPTKDTFDASPTAPAQQPSAPAKKKKKKGGFFKKLLGAIMPMIQQFLPGVGQMLGSLTGSAGG